MEISIKEYVIDFQQDDLSRFDEFYNAIKDKVFYNILALTKSYELSEDLLQDTFVKFLKTVKELNPNESILGYLMVISRNITLDYFKKNNRMRLIDEEKDNPSEVDEDDIDKNIILEKVKEILKPKEFEIFVMHVLSDLTFEEIAKIKKRPLGTITRAYNSAIKKLKGAIMIWKKSTIKR